MGNSRNMVNLFRRVDRLEMMSGDSVCLSITGQQAEIQCVYILFECLTVVVTVAQES